MELNDYSNPFSFRMSARIEFGIGNIKKVSDYLAELQARKILVVTDHGIVRAGILDKLLNVLHSNNFETFIHSDIHTEPDAEDVTTGTEILQKNKCETIISIGGGSSIDAGKAISVMATNEGHFSDYIGIGKLKHPGRPFIALPTTAGTGSEATIWAVISEKKKKIKYGVGSNFLLPTIALCDPELTLTLPPQQTALTGLDALGHALESYINKATQPISESLAERSLRLIAESLRVAVFAGNVMSARSNMLLASTMAALAFNSTRLGLAHALAMPIGAKAAISHAEAVAMLLPPVLRFNCFANFSKFAKLAEIFGEEIRGLSAKKAADIGLACALDLIQDVGPTRTLKDFGIQESDLENLAQEGMKSGNIAVNPRIAGVHDLIGILQECL